MGGAPSLPCPCHAFFTVISFLIGLITFGVAAGYGWKGELCFRQDSLAFRVALFADLHYGENAWTDWGPLQDVKSDRVISNVLDAEAPGDHLLPLRPDSDQSIIINSKILIAGYFSNT